MYWEYKMKKDSRGHGFKDSSDMIQNSKIQNPFFTGILESSNPGTLLFD
jgi:hypothetical protein